MPTGFISKLKGKKIMVTGGAGFIGSHIVDFLCVAGAEVSVVDNNIIKASDGGYANPKAKYIYCDIRKNSHLEEVFASVRPEYVLHCAAFVRVEPSWTEIENCYSTNVLGTVNILEMCKKFGVKKIVYSSSSSVYGNAEEMPIKETAELFPLNPYGSSKLFGENAVREFVRFFGIRACSLRYFNVYGPRLPKDSQYGVLIGIFLRQWKNGEKFTVVPDGYQRRDFTWVGDVVNANIAALFSKKAENGEAINIGGGKNYSVFEIGSVISGRPDYKWKFLPKRKGEARVTLASLDYAKELLGWEPRVSLEEGIGIIKNSS
jgi:UDP-glucose 4-epimerase